MAVVQVTGLPNTVKMPKLVFTMRGILRNVKVQQFWIKEIADMRNCDLKEAKIEFLNYEDAEKVAIKLDNFLFYEGNASSRLITKVIGGHKRHRSSPSPYRERNSNRHRGEYEHRPRDRTRSRSPVYNETSKLDVELELLRKQRMVIEEERRLLLERKKLELIKEYGPSATKEFEPMERSRKKRSRPKRDEYSHKSSFQGRPTSPMRYKYPLFHAPCKKILSQLRSLINEKAKPEEKTLLEGLLRMHIRKAIAIALTGKGFLSAEKIVKLYRESNPKTCDEEMVTSVLKNLRLSHWPAISKKEATVSESTNKETTEPPQEIQKNSETDADHSNSAADDIKVESNNVMVDETKKELTEGPEEVPTTLAKNIQEKLPEETAKEEPAQVQDQMDETDAADITVELTVDGPDDDWIENGTGWNDEDEAEEKADPAEL